MIKRLSIILCDNDVMTRDANQVEIVLQWITKCYRYSSIPTTY
jgi:hypothetical protein